jgi:homoserine kinase type II
MAVYTSVSAEALARFLARFPVGDLVFAKGIAEGVSNSNYLVETTEARFILTLYEARTEAADLPFFLSLTEFLAEAGLPVPRPVRDRSGRMLHAVAGRPAALVQFLPGVSVSEPTPAQAAAAGAALARLHLAGSGFPGARPNPMGLGWWQDHGAALAPALDRLAPGLAAEVATALERLSAHWPADLPAGIVHTDLFPDNVLMLGDRVTGLIDFYFACTDLYAYDLMVLHAAWCFAPDGGTVAPALEAALLAGYAGVRPLTRTERAALPLLGTGAALRFLLSRTQDWFDSPAGAFVSPKDPLPFARRLAAYAHRRAAA